jgi:hypothetical protein
MLLSIFSSVILGAATISALPTISARQGSTLITADLIQVISPNSATCDNAPIAAQCRTAAQVATSVSSSFSTYGITSAAEAAAVISLMAFESFDFKYQVNVYPGRPGQGTRNMQMINYNVLYAQSIPSLVANVTAITGGASGASLSTDQANAVRDLLTSDDNLDFGSGAWFLTTQCPAAIRTELQTGSLAGWEQYISSCVGTTVTDDREAYWTRAITELS